MANDTNQNGAPAPTGAPAGVTFDPRNDGDNLPQAEAWNQPAQSSPPTAPAQTTPAQGTAPAGVTFDFSKSRPVTPVAGAPQGVTFDFSKSRPVTGAATTPDFSVSGAVASPSTLYGQLTAHHTSSAPFVDIDKAVGDSLVSSDAKQKWAQVGQGASEVLHGRLSTGFHDMWAAAAPHVVQGSPLEQQMKTMNPNFKAEAAPADDRVPLNPIVDVGQFIDKQKHPMMKAIAETGSNFTTPANIAVLASTGGLGMVESPAALGMANKLISAGFAAQSLASAYAHLGAFKAAYDKGDEAEAKYQMTHAIMSGTVTALATAHAADMPIPAVKGSEAVAAAGKVASDISKGAVGDAARAVGDKVSSLGVKTGLIKPDAEAAAIQAIKPSAKATDKFGDDWNTAARDIKKFDETSKIETVGDLHEALPQIKENIWENEIEPVVREHRDMHIDMQQVKNDVLDTISPEVREFEPESIKDIEAFAEKMGETRTVASANRLLTYINGKLDTYFAKNPGAKRVDMMNNPDTAMWETARRGIREQFLQGLEAVGEEDIRGARLRYGALSGLQSAVEGAAARLAKTPYGSGSLGKVALAELLGNAGGAALGTAVGATIGGGIVGGGLVAGAEMLRKRNANPDVLLRHAIKTTEGTPPTTRQGGVPRPPLTPTGTEPDAMGLPVTGTSKDVTAPVLSDE